MGWGDSCEIFLRQIQRFFLSFIFNTQQATLAQLTKLIQMTKLAQMTDLIQVCESVRSFESGWSFEPDSNDQSGSCTQTTSNDAIA